MININIYFLFNKFSYINLIRMADLNALKTQFMALQKQSSLFKLSERTVVEIVNKIANRGKVQLLHTVTGKEYVVDGKVTIEIQNEIKKQKKISIMDLSKKLEIPINIIEKKVQQILSKNKNLTFVDGKVLTNDFLNSIIVDIKNILNHHSSASIAELSDKYELNIDFMKKFLKEKIDNGCLQNAKLYPTRIITDYYIELQKKKIKPALIASITPINIATIISQYNIDEMLINEIIEGLIKRKELKGSFTSNIFESELYSKSQNEYLKGELMQNNYIDYTKLKNIGINQNGKDYLKSLSKTEKIIDDGVFLNEYFISSVLKSNFEYTISDNLSKNLPTNLNTIFFFNIEEDDALTLLDSCGINSEQFIYINNNLIQNELIATFVSGCKDAVQDIASKEYNGYIEKMKQKEAKQNETVNEEENEGKGKKKGKKGKAKNKKGNSITAAKEDIVAELNKISIENFKKKFQSQNYFDEVNEKNDSLDYIFENKVLPQLQEMYSMNIKEFIKSKSNTQTISDPTTLMNKIDSDYLYLKLVQKYFVHLSSLSKNEPFQNSMKLISTYLCKKDLNNLLKDIMTYQIIHMKLKLTASKLNTYNERKEIIGIFPDDEIRDIFSKLNEYCQNKEFIKFMDLLTDNSKIIAVSLSIYDKKVEKSLIEKFNKELFDNVDLKTNMLGVLIFKDYIAFVCDICTLALGKKQFYIKMPYELWVIGLYINIFNENALGFGELKNKLNEIYDILNKDKNTKPEDIYTEKQGELEGLAKTLLNMV